MHIVNKVEIRIISQNIKDSKIEVHEIEFEKQSVSIAIAISMDLMYTLNAKPALSPDSQSTPHYHEKSSKHLGPPTKQRRKSL